MLWTGKKDKNICHRFVVTAALLRQLLQHNRMAGCLYADTQAVLVLRVTFGLRGFCRNTGVQIQQHL